MKKIFKNKYTYIFIAILLAIVIYFSFGRDDSEKDESFFLAEKSTVKKEVLVTGTVQPSEAVDLGVEKSGTVARVNVEIGDPVFTGTLLMSLDDSRELALLQEARASLSLEKTSYEELTKGTRDEQIKVSEASLEKEKSTLNSYYNAVSETLDNAYNKAENAVNKQTDLLFNNDYSSAPELTFTTISQQNGRRAESERVVVQTSLKNIKEASEAPLQSEVEKESALLQVRTELFEIQNFLNSVNTALNSASDIVEPTLTNHKTNIDIARTNINNAISAVNTDIKNIETQRAVVNKASKELTLAKAPPTEEELSIATSRINQAEARVRSLESDLAKTSIRSPINGIVTEVEAKTGEIVTAGSYLVSIINTNSLQIEANVPEADISEIIKGARAEVTLDAYGSDEIFYATVATINPAEKVIDGVPTYKTTLIFESKDPRIKSGMTANISIITETKENVVSIPARSIIYENGKTFVKIKTSPETEEQREIKTGIRGSDGSVEVTEGLSEGEKILLNVN